MASTPKVAGSGPTGRRDGSDSEAAAADVSITTTTSTGPAWQAYQVNVGDSGWKGQETRLCLNFGHKSYSSTRLNTYYTASKSSTNKKVIWG